jgi:hypothetical protein
MLLHADTIMLLHADTIINTTVTIKICISVFPEVWTEILIRI